MSTNTETASDILSDVADCYADIKTMTGKQYVIISDDEVDGLRDEIARLRSALQKIRDTPGDARDCRHIAGDALSEALNHDQD